jgi:acetyltransferase-like isoleucine patch superfamily enzyme
MAQVDDTAKIGVGTKVWQFASVIRGAKIGKDCTIASCSIVDGAQIGYGCKVGHGASIHPGVKAGNCVFIGPGAIACNDMWPETDTEGFDLQRLLDGEFTVIIGDGATVGAAAVILPGVRIGAGAFVAAGAVVDRPIPEGFLWRRNGYLAPMPVGTRERRMRYISLDS